MRRKLAEQSITVKRESDVRVIIISLFVYTTCLSCVRWDILCVKYAFNVVHDVSGPGVSRRSYTKSYDMYIE